MASLYTNTELFLANTTNNSGTINLPVASSIPGRVIEFKDSNGTFNTKTLTLVCNGSDKFEDGSSTKILNTKFGNLQLVASGSKWYILNGTQVNTFQVSSLTTIAISSFLTNTSSINVSTLGFIDNRNSTNTLYTSTSFLFYNNFIISGTRVGYSNITNKFSFTPLIIPGIVLWLDAQNGNSYTASGTTVTSIKDLGPNNYQFSGTTGTTIGATLFNGSYRSFYSSALGTLGITPTNTFSLPEPFTVFVVGLVVSNYSIMVSSDTSFLLGMYTSTYGLYTHRQIFNDYSSTSVNGTHTSPFFGSVVFTANPSGYTNGVSAGNNGGFIDGTQSFFTGQNEYAAITSVSGNGTTVTVNFASTTTFIGITTITITGVTGYNGTYTITSGPITGAITSLTYASTTTTTPSYYFAYVYYGAGRTQNGTLTIQNYGHLCEMMVFNGVVTTTQRQQIEGYLAWKWGLQANLPAGHPYINGPP